MLSQTGRKVGHRHISQYVKLQGICQSLVGCINHDRLRATHPDESNVPFVANVFSGSVAIQLKCAGELCIFRSQEYQDTVCAKNYED